MEMKVCGIVLVLLAVCAAQGSGSFYCSVIADHLDCSTYPPSRECGSDGRTYENTCYFSQAHCHNVSLHVDHAGACHDKTTVGKRPGYEVAFHLFCIELMHLTCPGDKHPTCGSDGHEYPNLCEFEKTKCTHRNLNITNLGPCSMT